MASMTYARLVTANTRDGADTRKKDVVTRLGGGVQEQVGQTAALYMIPPNAEVVGSSMHAYWSNYRRLADAYVNGEVDRFIWVPYKEQQSYNEQDIQARCNTTTDGLYNSCGASTEGVLNVYREFYNRAITEFRKSLNSNDLEDALEYLVDFQTEKAKQETAAKTIQSWFRSFPKISETGTLVADDEPEDYGKCVNCDEPRIGMFVELCADCYWSEDAEFKRLARVQRQNAIPPSKYEPCEACRETKYLSDDNAHCWECYFALREWEDENLRAIEREH